MTTDIRLDILYKKFVVGVPTAYPNGNPSTEAGFNKPLVFPSLQVISQDIPSNAAPTDLSNVTITYLNPVVSGTQKQVSTSKPHIAKYTKLPLIDVGGGAGFAFGYSKTQSLNLCTNSIPSNYDLITGTYEVKVYNNAGTQIYSNNSTYPWVFDGDAGVLLFTGGNPLPAVPSITFWRYEGTFGVSAGGSTFTGGTVSNDISLNARLSVGSDVSLGGRLFVGGNTELSGNLLIKGNLAVQQYQNQNIINTTTTNYQLIVSEDISLNGRLFASGDTSLNSRLYVAGTSTLNGDASFNSRVLVSSDVSLGGRLFIPSNASLIIGGVAFTGGGGGSTFTGGTVINDISANAKLFVGGDVSMNSRLFVTNAVGIGITNPNYTLDVSGNAEFTQDISMGGKLLVGSDVSMNSRLFVTNAVGIGITNPNYKLDVSGNAEFTQDISMGGKLLVGSDVSLGGRLFVGGNTELSGNLLIKGNLAVQQYQNQNIINTTTTNYKLIVSEDISLNGRLFTSGDVSLNGNVSIGRGLRPTTISEPFITNTGTTSPYTFDYNQGATFYVTLPPATNFTVNITGVPSDINRTYCFTLIISSATNKRFCNSLQINGATAITPNFAGGIPTITTASFITQSISIQRLTAGDLTANVNVFSAVTSWY